MNAGPVADRVYASLRARILAHHYRPGERLDGVELAEQLSSSVTPVRDALNRLAGEGLVDSGAGEGFHLPAVDEPGLADLYRWSGDLVGLALRSRRGAAPPTLDMRLRSGSVADRTTELFEAIAALSANVEHMRAIRACNARLAAARTVEPALFTDTEQELQGLIVQLEGCERSALRSAARRYHMRRVRHAGALVRMLYRSPPPTADNL